MTTAVYDSLTDNSAKDGTGDAINGAEVDANPQALAQILDGTSAVQLGGAGDITLAGGLVVGHTAQLTLGGVVCEVQEVGTAAVDSSLGLAGFSATAGTAPGLFMARSKAAAVGTYTIVADDDTLGGIYFSAADGVDFATIPASIVAKVDDATPAADTIGSELIFRTTVAEGTIADRVILSGSALYPATDDGVALGIANTNEWSDLHLAPGAVLSWNNAAETITQSAGILTVGSADLHMADATGVVVGHTAQLVTGGVTAEAQVVGTAAADSSLALSGFSATAGTAPGIFLARSKAAAVGTYTIVADNDTLGSIQWAAADGVDFATVAASIVAKVDDATPAADTVGSELILRNTAAEGTIADRVILSSSALYPATDDGVALGIKNTNDWSDLFLATGAVIDWENADVTLTHSANTLTIAGGDLVAPTIFANGDTSAGDTAAMGYTAAEGAILTGQGTTYDVTLKNDADANVLGIPTGTAFVAIGDDANANMTQGLTINQGESDDEIFALKSSDVAHGMTTQAETDTYGLIKKGHATGGGLNLRGFTDAHADAHGAVRIFGALGEAADTGKTGTSRGILRLEAYIRDGTGLTVPGSNQNLMNIEGGGTTVFIFDVEGSGHAEVEWTTFDAEQDALAVRDFEHMMLGRFGENMAYQQDDFERLGIVGKDSVHIKDGKLKGMVNFTKLSMLHLGALMQATDERQALREALDEKDTRIMALEQKMALIEEKN